MEYIVNEQVHDPDRIELTIFEASDITIAQIVRDATNDSMYDLISIGRVFARKSRWADWKNPSDAGCSKCACVDVVLSRVLGLLLLAV